MLARKSTFAIASDLTNALLGYVALYIIARLLNPAMYGLVVFATGFVALMTLYGDLGFDSAHIKYVSSGEDQAQCTSVYLTVEMALLFIDVLVIIVALFIWQVVFNKGFESADTQMVVYIILLSTIFRGLAVPFLGVYTAKREIVKVKFATLAGTIIRLSGIVLVGLLHLGIFMFAFVYVAEGATIFIFAVLFFRGHKLAFPKKRYFKLYYSFAIPMAFAGFFGVAITNFSPVIIQLCFSSATVGYYSAAYRVITVLGIFTGSLGVLLFPTLSSLHSSGDMQGMRDLICDSERYLSMIAFPLIFATMALAIPISFVLLAGWMPAAAILQIIPLCFLFSSIEQPYTGQLLGSNNPKFMRNKMFIAFCINIGLCILLVPRDLFGTHLAGLGGVGAAIALVSSSFASWLYSRTMSRRILPGIKINKCILLHAGCAGFLALVVYYLTTVVSITHWYSLIGIALLYFCSYLGLLVLFKEFTKKDLTLMISMLDIRKLYQYAKDEIKK